MVFKCCVPLCKGNYNGGPRVHVFSFPRDPELKKKWIYSIKRDNFVPTKNSKVCELHFSPCDIEKETCMYLEETGETLSAPLKIPRLRKDAVPTKLPGAPSYLSTDVSIRESVKERQTIRENRHLQMAISKSIMSKKSEDSKSVFTTFSELQNCLNYKYFNQKFTVVMRSNAIVIGIFEVSPPVFKYCISINNSMQLSAFHQSAELKVLNDIKLPMHVKSIHEINNILNSLELLEAGAPESIVNIINFIKILMDKLEAIVSDDKKCILTFLKEQLNLLCLPKQRLRYSPHFLIFACILNSISPHAYKFMRNSGNLIMPHPVTLRNICSNLNVSVSEEQQHSNFLRYIKQKFKTLKECEHNIILMMDEIHLKPFYDFKGGNIVGSAYDSAFAASSAYTFMIRSLLSSYKDVAHILIKITYQNPYEPHRPLFFVIDPVHLLKCILNNWIGQKNDGLCMYFPKFNAVGSEAFNAASFNTLRKLHDLEFDSLIKYGYGLTLKALWPSNLERQNVKLVLQVFNNWVITALTELGNKHNLDNYETTADYIDIIYKWWCIVNTKTPLKGKRLKCSFQEPLTFSNVDSNVEYLNNFVNWLDKWKDAKCTTGCLSKETHDALRNTTYALIELGKYCIKELGMNYFLPGKIQTDLLEDRFGKYRQLSGSQYCISIRQVYESESKLRMQSLLPLKLSSSTFGNIAIEINERNDCEEENIDLIDLSLEETFSLVVSENDIMKSQPYVAMLTYIAGYCLYSTFKKYPCEFCKINCVIDRELNIPSEFNLIRKLDRGGLLYPMPHVLNVVLYNFIVVQKLVSQEFESKFLKHPAQRNLAINLTLNALMSNEDFDTETCVKGHSFDLIAKSIIKSSTNTMLNNYCKQKNDFKKPSCKKRKLSSK